MEFYREIVNNLSPATVKLNNISADLKAAYLSAEPLKLAKAALSFSAAFASKITGQSWEKPDCFSILKAHMINRYKSYQDKAKLKGKQDNLHKAMRNVQQHLSVRHTMTATEMREMSKELCDLCDTAARLETELRLIGDAQSQEEPEERLEQSIVT